MKRNAAAIAAEVSAPASPLVIIPHIPHILILSIWEPVNVLILTEQKTLHAISIKQCDAAPLSGIFTSAAGPFEPVQPPSGNNLDKTSAYDEKSPAGTLIAQLCAARNIIIRRSTTR